MQRVLALGPVLGLIYPAPVSSDELDQKVPCSRRRAEKQESARPPLNKPIWQPLIAIISLTCDLIEFIDIFAPWNSAISAAKTAG
jgi:hypothetical protein